MTRKKYKSREEECRVFSTGDRFVSCILSQGEKDVYESEGDDEGCYQKKWEGGKEIFRCKRVRRLNGQ